MTSQIVLHLPSFSETTVVYAKGLEASAETPAVTALASSINISAEVEVPVISAVVSTSSIEGEVGTVVTADVSPVEVTAERDC